MDVTNALGTSLFGKCLITFAMAMVPVIELRGAIPMGVTMGLPVGLSAALGIMGNLVPVPFIIVFIRKIFRWMRARSKSLGRIADNFECKAKERGERFYTGELIGLMVFVAIPLPGTGAWSGALIAAILNLRLKTAYPAIAAGVCIAGLLVSGLTYGFKAVFT